MYYYKLLGYLISGYQELIQNTKEHTTPNCTYYDMAKSKHSSVMCLSLVVSIQGILVDLPTFQHDYSLNSIVSK